MSGRDLRSDTAASDFVAAILLMMAVVVLGSVVTGLVASQLSSDQQTSDATFALGEADPGDNELNVTLSNGERIPLANLKLSIQRGGSSAAEVPSSSWTTASPDALSAGEKIKFSVSPPIAADEEIVVRLFRSDSNEMAALLTTRAGTALPALVQPTLGQPACTPCAIPNDATTTALVTVPVSHTEGVLAVADVKLNFSLSVGGGPFFLDLNDAGRDGDASGGDGVWSGLLRMPTVTSPSTRVPTFDITDATGRQWKGVAPAPPFSSLSLDIVDADPGSGGSGGGGGGSEGNSSSGGGAGGGSGIIGNFSGNSSGNFTGEGGGNWTGNTRGNHSGDVDGAFIGVGAGKRATEGTRFKVPISANVTNLTFENWTWDRFDPTKLDYDGMVIRVLAGNASWSVYMKFDYTGSGSNKPGNTPKLVSMTMYSNTAKVAYVPANTNASYSPLNLTTLKLNLLNPLGSGQWVYENPGTGTPGALYQNSNITDNPFVVISFMRDERGQGQGSSGQALETGIFGVDVVFT